MQSTTDLSVAGMRALSLKAGITMLYFGPTLWLISSVTFSSPLSIPRPMLLEIPGNASGHHKRRRAKLACGGSGQGIPPSY